MSSSEVTIVVGRTIDSGHEKEYDAWLARLLEAERRAPGFLGATVIERGGRFASVRYIVHRFRDDASYRAWGTSPEREGLMEEVKHYSRPHYETGTGFETWFKLPEVKAMVPPPRWKMMIVTFGASYFIALATRTLLAEFAPADWPVLAVSGIFSGVLVVSLSYTLPLLTRVFRRWLYPPGRPTI